MSQRSRNQLKTYFTKNAIPSEQDYAELIDGMINQHDDHIVKRPGSPLGLEAIGDAASRRQVLHMYEEFDDANPAWTLSLNPRAVVSDPSTARNGFSIDDRVGKSRLFIDEESGNVGIGTIEPLSPLHVASDARVDGMLRVGFGDSAPQPSLRVAGDILCDRAVRAASFHSTATPLEWVEVELQGGWRWYGDAPNTADTYARPAYCKDLVGCVHLRGLMNRPQGGGQVVLFTLPEGFRPSARQIFICPTYAGHGSQRALIDVMANGDVWLRSGHWAWIALDTIHFMTLP